MISNGCLYHLVRVRDVYFETPLLESIPIVNEFLRVFSNDVLGITLERIIDIVLTCAWIRTLFLFLLIEWFRRNLKS